MDTYSLILVKVISRITTGTSVIICIGFTQRVSHNTDILSQVEVEPFIALWTNTVICDFAVDIADSWSVKAVVNDASDSLDFVTFVAGETYVSFSVGFAERVDRNAFSVLRTIVKRRVTFAANAKDMVDDLAVAIWVTWSHLVGDWPSGVYRSWSSCGALRILKIIVIIRWIPLSVDTWWPWSCWILSIWATWGATLPWTLNIQRHKDTILSLSWGALCARLSLICLSIVGSCWSIARLARCWVPCVAWNTTVIRESKAWLALYADKGDQVSQLAVFKTVVALLLSRDNQESYEEESQCIHC